MGYYVPFALTFTLFLMVVLGVYGKSSEHSIARAWILVVGIIGLIAMARAYQIVTNWQFVSIYITLITLQRVITFFGVYLYYIDPATLPPKDSELEGRVSVHYVVPVHNDPIWIIPCIRSILAAAENAADIADVHVTVVNDASTDNTLEVLIREFGDLPNVTIMHLEKNVGKKGALACGMLGGPNWREAYYEFDALFHRLPQIEDYYVFADVLLKVGCLLRESKIICHCDSDSQLMSLDYIRKIVAVFRCNPRIGAVSGHCDVWKDEQTMSHFFTRLQIAWYDIQFAVLKAIESVFGGVLCVSGPAAAFRSKVIFPVIKTWVDDRFGGMFYRGATDRMITLLVLMMGYQTVYTRSAKVATVVPQNLYEARRQWTRWKQNFWRMLIPVTRFAWRLHPVVAYLTYTRLLVTVVAPFVLAYHGVLLLLGNVEISLLYLTGIAFFGSIAGLAYLIRNPREWRYALYRPLMSLTSSLLGSIWTLAALHAITRGVFTWREGQTRRRGWRSLFTVEMNFLIVIFIITLVIYVLKSNFLR